MILRACIHRTKGMEKIPLRRCFAPMNTGSKERSGIMPTVIGVRFKAAGKVYYFDPGELVIKEKDHVIVETARGVEYGLVIFGPKEVSEEEVVPPLKMVLRVATAEDDKKVEDNKRKEQQAFSICLEKISKHNLPMKLIEVEYTFDNSKVIFFFTAEGRVDFRELVKDLATVFRTRIELRQIGVRDEAKMLGGIGFCGRPLCCHSFLGDFAPVSIKMAKEQNLSLNPSKISGICGRLLCCLKYENDVYVQNKKEMNSHKVKNLDALTKANEPEDNFDLSKLED